MHPEANTAEADAYRAGVRAGLEMAARELDCACPWRDKLLVAAAVSGTNSRARWEWCHEASCRAIEARDIRALADVDGEA